MTKSFTRENMLHLEGIMCGCDSCWLFDSINAECRVWNGPMHIQRPQYIDLECPLFNSPVVISMGMHKVPEELITDDTHLKKKTTKAESTIKDVKKALAKKEVKEEKKEENRVRKIKGYGLEVVFNLHPPPGRLGE